MTTKIQKALAKNLKFFMAEKNFKPTPLAITARISQGSLTDAINGEGANGLSVVSLGRLAEALGVEPGDLVDDWRED
ncbi:helix-turn-helix domain-containing protein [Secundilactobacillus kimchicus]|uniref:helix-turn-helix domain-containing protein n=1 Tax=Secundilactobacillus kimchicus TaxID=528209 RepID=UPI001C024E6C|nr:helix-turn-helix transcriptional regulator [Secundilactobacillus kimchicus]MBT9670438.1 helix-turn-helix domain-containing protein [Secundilactobacillus kimchicus]